MKLDSSSKIELDDVVFLIIKSYKKKYHQIQMELSKVIKVAQIKLKPFMLSFFRSEKHDFSSTQQPKIVFYLFDDKRFYLK